jgi:6,7-dimethyl-8-ribityllumazine synthase
MSVQEAQNMQNRFPAGWDTPKVEAYLKEKRPQVVVLKTLWYPEVIEGLYESTQKYWTDSGLSPDNFACVEVPGSFELALAAQMAFEGRLEGIKRPADIVITLGCVIKGETPHFDFVCSSCAQGLRDVQLKANKPLGFGVLTVNTLEQALARRNKGFEASQAALYMALITKAR